MPCPSKAFCPNGLGSSNYEDDRVAIWAPVLIDVGYSDDSYAWMELRQGGYCMKHPVIEVNGDVTRYALCSFGHGSGGCQNVYKPHYT